MTSVTPTTPYLFSLILLVWSKVAWAGVMALSISWITHRFLAQNSIALLLVEIKKSSSSSQCGSGWFHFPHWSSPLRHLGMASQEWVAFLHHPTYQGPWNPQRCKTPGQILVSSPLSPLNVRSMHQQVELSSRLEKLQVSQSWKHSLGHEVDTCTKVTKSIPNFLIVYCASDSRITSVAPMHNCWRFPWIKNLLYWLPCIVSRSYPPRWLTPSSGHYTNIFTGRYGLPRNLLVLSGGNQSSYLSQLGFYHFIKS
jgi:hypothetical protein